MGRIVVVGTLHSHLREPCRLFLITPAGRKPAPPSCGCDHTVRAEMVSLRPSFHPLARFPFDSVTAILRCLSRFLTWRWILPSAMLLKRTRRR